MYETPSQSVRERALIRALARALQIVEMTDLDEAINIVGELEGDVAKLVGVRRPERPAGTLRPRAQDGSTLTRSGSSLTSSGRRGKCRRSTAPTSPTAWTRPSRKRSPRKWASTASTSPSQ